LDNLDFASYPARATFQTGRALGENDRVFSTFLDERYLVLKVNRRDVEFRDLGELFVVWDLETGQEVFRMNEPPPPPGTYFYEPWAGLQPNGTRWLASSSNRIFMADLATGQEVPLPDLQGREWRTTEWQEDGSLLVLTSDGAFERQFWRLSPDLSQGELFGDPLPVPRVTYPNIYITAESELYFFLNTRLPNGQGVLLIAGPSRLLLMDSTTGNILQSYDYPPNFGNSEWSYGPTGNLRYIAIGGENTVTVYAAESGAPLFQVESRADENRNLELGGDFLAVYNGTDTVDLYHIPSGEKRNAFNLSVDYFYLSAQGGYLEIRRLYQSDKRFNEIERRLYSTATGELVLQPAENGYWLFGQERYYFVKEEKILYDLSDPAAPVAAPLPSDVQAADFIRIGEEVINLSAIRADGSLTLYDVPLRVSQPSAQASPAPTEVAAVNVPADWLTYTDAALGASFRYPPTANVEALPFPNVTAGVFGQVGESVVILWLRDPSLAAIGEAVGANYEAQDSPEREALALVSFFGDAEISTRFGATSYEANSEFVRVWLMDYRTAEGGDWFFVLVFADWVQDFDQQATLETMLASLQITPPVGFSPQTAAPTQAPTEVVQAITCQVTGNGINVRAQPSVNSDIVTQLRGNNATANAFTVGADGLKWYYLSELGGFVREDVATVEEACAALPTFEDIADTQPCVLKPRRTFISAYYDTEVTYFAAARFNGPKTAIAQREAQVGTSTEVFTWYLLSDGRLWVREDNVTASFACQFLPKV
jgi:WD40 repeat protein